MDTRVANCETTTSGEKSVKSDISNVRISEARRSAQNLGSRKYRSNIFKMSVWNSIHELITSVVFCQCILWNECHGGSLQDFPERHAVHANEFWHIRRASSWTKWSVPHCGCCLERPLFHAENKREMCHFDFDERRVTKYVYLLGSLTVKQDSWASYLHLSLYWHPAILRPASGILCLGVDCHFPSYCDDNLVNLLSNDETTTLF